MWVSLSGILSLRAIRLFDISLTNRKLSLVSLSQRHQHLRRWLQLVLRRVEWLVDIVRRYWYFPFILLHQISFSIFKFLFLFLLFCLASLQIQDWQACKWFSIYFSSRTSNNRIIGSRYTINYSIINFPIIRFFVSLRSHLHDQWNEKQYSNMLISPTFISWRVVPGRCSIHPCKSAICDLDHHFLSRICSTVYICTIPSGRSGTPELHMLPVI